MNRKTSILIISCFCVSAMTIVVMFLLSHRANHENNSFVRLFPPHVVKESAHMDLGYNSYYIAGASSDNIYLGNLIAPLHVLVSNTFLTDTQHLRINIKNIDSINFKTIHVKVEPPSFFILDGNMPGVFKGDVSSWEATQYLKNGLHFIESVPIGPKSFAIRTMSSNREYILAKETLTNPTAKLAPELLQKQVDGIFCTDGKLLFDKTSKRMTYVYYYRNQYVCFDTSMNLLFRGNTIDTISRAQIKVTKVSSNNSYTMNAPPLIVNKHCSVSNGWLFVHSNLLAKNEDKEVFDDSSVIDVYDLTKGAYQFSFYLFDYADKKLREFSVIDYKILAIYDRYLVVYDLNQNLLPEI